MFTFTFPLERCKTSLIKIKLETKTKTLIYSFVFCSLKNKKLQLKENWKTGEAWEMEGKSGLWKECFYFQKLKKGKMQKKHLKSSVCLYLLFPTYVVSDLRQTKITMKQKESIGRQRSPEIKKKGSYEFKIKYISLLQTYFYFTI